MCDSALGPSFKEKFAEIYTCGSCEQCTGPTQKNAAASGNVQMRYPNLAYI